MIGRYKNYQEVAHGAPGTGTDDPWWWSNGEDEEEEEPDDGREEDDDVQCGRIQEDVPD